jgi:ubiquinone/menaquinone biosynthesis C-methylase UbiE
MPPRRRRLELLTNLGSRVDQDELLDRGRFDPVELEGNLRDIRTVNRLAGGQGAVLVHLPGLIARVDRERPVEVLDLATGSGDIPAAVAAWATRNARPLRLTVSDVSAEILALAQSELERVAGVTFALWDAREVPRPDRSFDVVLCSLALHHFAPPDAIRVLREMQRLARVGFIVNDIRRSAPGYVAAWVASHLATRNRLTRHDMPLSVRRGYTPGELRALLQEAGVSDASVTTHPLFRMAAVYCRSDR